MAKDKDYSKYFLKAMERAAESGGSLSSQSETESQDDAAYESSSQNKKEFLDSSQIDMKKASENPENQTIVDDASIMMMYNNEKYHEHLLNSMNIRVDASLTEHFAEYVKGLESEQDSNHDSSEESSGEGESIYNSDEDEGQIKNSASGDLDDNKPKTVELTNQDCDSKSGIDDEEEKIQLENNESDHTLEKYDQIDYDQSYGEDYNKSELKIIENPFLELPAKTILLMNKEIQKLHEGNRRLKAKINIMEKQMKTTDPVKKWKYVQQIERLSKPGSLKTYYLSEPYPQPDSTVYYGEFKRNEEGIKQKLDGLDGLDDGKDQIGESLTIPQEMIHSVGFTDVLAPGAIFQGFKFIGDTFGRMRDECSLSPGSARSDYKKGNNIDPSQGSAIGGRRRRYRRRANQISRSYVCSIATCRKAYGSEGSLNQHMKIKHPECYQHGGFPGRRRGRMEMLKHL